MRFKGLFIGITCMLLGTQVHAVTLQQMCSITDVTSNLSAIDGDSIVILNPDSFNKFLGKTDTSKIIQYEGNRHQPQTVNISELGADNICAIKRLRRKDQTTRQFDESYCDCVAPIQGGHGYVINYNQGA